MCNGMDILFWQVTLLSEIFLEPIATDNPKGIVSKFCKRKNIYCIF